ncbi:hypothetical protein [Streptomyces sp. TRM68367]|uniref:hypothetical protein n=1 Tax=Streptomyces sp. TRM68367 TaxID=2758415 RepID=UPI00165AEA25|nr:hypothetical protein [Streptomyces sp. TRM68367]MBC9730658.1 hypothetical protein [Streptomyces sp. TRM68367]
MGIRIRLATGLLLAATAGGVVVGLAPAAGASPVVEACKARAQYWTEETRILHMCRHKDGSDGIAAGWWVWMYS